MLSCPRCYQVTSHSTTCIAPATCLFSRPICIHLPEMKHLQNDDKIRNNDTLQKEKIWKYSDDRRCNLEIGNKILLKNAKNGVTQSYYAKDQFIVINVK